jgi:hypothetical protein
MISRPICNIFYRNSHIEEKIKQGKLLPEEIEKEKGGYFIFSNRRFYSFGDIFKWMISNRESLEMFYI